MESFDNRIAVITGGGSGIGRALVTQLAQAGCHVAFCDLSEEGMQGTLDLCAGPISEGVRVTAHRCDVTSESELQRLRDEVAQQHATDHIHLLFNNAGISGGQSFINDPREQWDRTFAICWGGVYLGCRVFLDMVVAAPEARIINTSSVNGFWACLGAHTEHSAYSTAKFAVKGFSESLLVDMRCNAPHVGVSVVMRHTSLGYDALFHVLVVTNSVCLAALVAVVLHLRRNFVPATGSIRAAQLARRESFSDDCREARTS